MCSWGDQVKIVAGMFNKHFILFIFYQELDEKIDTAATSLC